LDVLRRYVRDKRFRAVIDLPPAWKIAFFIIPAANVRQRSNGLIGTALVGDF
jgi:hypothetical protein